MEKNSSVNLIPIKYYWIVITDKVTSQLVKVGPWAAATLNLHAKINTILKL